VQISLNVAPATLAHPAFIRHIGACLERHCVAPMYLTFEMPESSVLTNDPGFLERLVRLRMIGYGLAIDDFGTGRSNLQLLARVPFTELKIDRSFVDGASRRRALGTVLGSCLGLARSLDRESCAVGVETRQDWDFRWADDRTLSFQGWAPNQPDDGPGVDCIEKRNDATQRWYDRRCTDGERYVCERPE